MEEHQKQPVPGVPPSKLAEYQTSNAKIREAKNKTSCYGTAMVQM
jgi:hypothetical protein